LPLTIVVRALGLLPGFSLAVTTFIAYDVEKPISGIISGCLMSFWPFLLASCVRFA